MLTHKITKMVHFFAFSRHCTHWWGISFQMCEQPKHKTLTKLRIVDIGALNWVYAASGEAEAPSFREKPFLHRLLENWTEKAHHWNRWAFPASLVKCHLAESREWTRSDEIWKYVRKSATSRWRWDSHILFAETAPLLQSIRKAVIVDIIQHPACGQLSDPGISVK